MLYRVFDLVVESEIALLDVEPTFGGTPTLFVKRSHGASQMPQHPAWTDIWRPTTGTRTLSDVAWSFAWQGRDLLLAIRNCGEFRLTDGFQTLVCYPYPQAGERVLRSQLSYSLIPRILGELGHLVVHASCVLVEGVGSLVFMGPSGAGKSTLAASFAADGAALVSDDCVLLRNTGGSLVAFVTGAYARLWEDSLTNVVGANHNASRMWKTDAGSKWHHRFGLNRSVPSSTPVSAIFDVSAPESPGECADITISEESGARFLSVLTSGSLLFDGSRKRNSRRTFAGASDVANACPAFYAIRYPRRFELLSRVRAAIVDRVERHELSGRRGIAS